MLVENKNGQNKSLVGDDKALCGYSWAGALRTELEYREFDLRSLFTDKFQEFFACFRLVESTREIACSGG